MSAYLREGHVDEESSTDGVRVAWNIAEGNIQDPPIIRQQLPGSGSAIGRPVDHEDAK